MYIARTSVIMGKVKALSVLQKRRSFKNLFCFPCKLWITESNVSRHLNGDRHEAKLKKQNRGQLKNRVSDGKSKSICKKIIKKPPNSKNGGASDIYQTPEKQFDTFVIQGSTLKKASPPNDRHIISISSSSSLSPDLFGDVRKNLYKNQHSSNDSNKTPSTHKIRDTNDDLNSRSPDLFGSTKHSLDTSQNHLCALDDDTPSTVSPLNVHNSCENARNSFQDNDFPLSLLSGAFPCGDFHDNQIGYYRCGICNPNGCDEYPF
jgi:hypothetical protein